MVFYGMHECILYIFDVIVLCLLKEKIVMKKNKRRADAYFGLHFDFHATDLVSGIGSKTTAEEIGQFLDTVKPDYLQLDTKGHPGYSSGGDSCAWRTYARHYTRWVHFMSNYLWAPGGNYFFPPH